MPFGPFWATVVEMRSGSHLWRLLGTNFVDLGSHIIEPLAPWNMLLLGSVVS